MTPRPPTDVSVCIVSWNVRDDLLACLNSIYGPESRVSFEVIIVDNASTDDTVAAIKQHYPIVKLITNEENRGFAAGCNQGIQQAGGRYILLLNPDTIVPLNALDELVSFADEHPQAGIIGPQLLYPDGRLQYSCRHFPTVAAALFRHTFLSRLVPGARSVTDYLMSNWDHNETRAVDWVSGACMLLRRELIEDIGLLDDQFFWGSEDVDYCWRAHQAGWQILYTPQPQVIHAVGHSSNKAVIPTIINFHRSMYRLYSKHLAGWFGSRWLVGIGIWLRAALLIGHTLLQRIFSTRRPHQRR